jgi:hypothetical protein
VAGNRRGGQRIAVLTTYLTVAFGLAAAFAFLPQSSLGNAPAQTSPSPTPTCPPLINCIPLGTPTPSPVPTASPVPTILCRIPPCPTISPTPTDTPAATPPPTPTPTHSPPPTAKPTPTASANPTPSSPPSPGMTPSASPSPSASPTASPTSSPTPAPTPVVGPVVEPPSSSPTPAPTTTPTAASPSPSLSPQPTPLSLVGSLPKPTDVSLSPTAAGLSVLLVALLLLLALFPATLFNKTLEENYDSVARWFGLGGRRLADVRAALSRFWKSRIGVISFLLLSALIYGFLDPTFGPNANSLAIFIGVLGGLVVTTAAFEAPIAIFQERINREPGIVRVLPLTIVVALACVLVSRAASFQPGYLYGLIAGYAFSRPLSKRDAGLSVALTSVLIFLLSIGCWLVLPSVNDWLAGAPWLQLLATTALAVVFIAGLESLLLELLPLRFLRGTQLWDWSKTIWLALFAVSGLAFVHILLHPGVNYLFEARGDAIAVAVFFFIAFGLLSISFWAYFRWRARPEAEPVEAGSGEV